MKIGYACINESLGKLGRFKSVTVKKSKEMNKIDLHDKLRNIALYNANTVLRIIKWNIEHGIKLYRLPSGMIPLDTHELNCFDWRNDTELLRVYDSIKLLSTQHDIRLSMHPDQFCVLSSDNPTVVFNTVQTLEYHADICDLVGADNMVIHLGSTKGGKIASMSRFIDGFQLLSDSAKSKLILENDDKSYTISEILDVCETINIPCCLDIHHHNCNPTDEPIKSFIDRVEDTWKHRSTRPKCHLSTGATDKTDRKHHDYISEEDYYYAVEVTKARFDIMFECKKKDLSVLKFMEN
jgi:UV DNA damage endonuclease